MKRGMRLWGWPIAVGLFTAVGLVTALLGDGAWDYLSWASLGAVTLLGVFVSKKM